MKANPEMDELLRRLKEILELESIDGTTTFSDCEAWDSLSRLSIISTVDDLYHLHITGREINSVDTVNDLLILIKTKKEGNE